MAAKSDNSVGKTLIGRRTGGHGLWDILGSPLYLSFSTLCCRASSAFWAAAASMEYMKGLPLPIINPIPTLSEKAARGDSSLHVCGIFHPPPYRHGCSATGRTAPTCLSGGAHKQTAGACSGILYLPSSCWQRRRRTCYDTAWWPLQSTGCPSWRAGLCPLASIRLGQQGTAQTYVLASLPWR